MTDDELVCASCSHVGLARSTSWPGVTLDESEASRPAHIPLPIQRVRTITAVALECAHCGAKNQRVGVDAEKQRAKGELIADRLATALPVAPKDLRAFLRANQHALHNSGDLLWKAIGPHLIDVDGESTPHFVMSPTAPDWVPYAIGHLESLGWLGNAAGEVFFKIPQKQDGIDIFAEPAVEHVGFSAKTAN